MILIDPRDGGKKRIPGQMPSDLLKAYLISLGIVTEKFVLEYGDAQFEGNGPEGPILIGVERKTLHDMLNCIDDARYNQQRIGMAQMYQKSILLLEGEWRPHDQTGLLMEGFRKADGSIVWGYLRYRSQPVHYSKLYRYLMSVSLSGVTVTYSRDLWHTAFNIHEMYWYFQKKWHDHTSLLEVQKLNIPTLNEHPSLCREWAARIKGVGVKYSEEAERMFKTPRRLANSDETEWVKIGRIGVETAKKIVRQINGK